MKQENKTTYAILFTIPETIPKNLHPDFSYRPPGRGRGAPGAYRYRQYAEPGGCGKRDHPYPASGTDHAYYLPVSRFWRADGKLSLRTPVCQTGP